MRRKSKTLSPRTSRHLSALVLVLLTISSRRLAAEENALNIHPVEQIGLILKGLCDDLSLQASIEVSIVAHNERMVSVERGISHDAFLLSFDEQFLTSLTDEELTAAVAHELGHIWIFSHHPYLQTEALANQIAMRTVSRESLKKMYLKLWAHLGLSGNISELLGPEN
jgi:hypothetical protein